MYTIDGWIDYNKIDGYGKTVNILVGGRGIGKSYGLLKYLLYDNTYEGKLFYLRRTNEEIEICCNSELNPFNELNRVFNRNIQFKKQGKVYYIVEDENIIGIAGALTSISKIRGMSGIEYTNIVFDECIKPYNARRLMKDEGFEFLNLYETLNRNREMQGENPLRAFLLSNSNFMGNDLFITFNLIDAATKIKSDNVFPGVYINDFLLYVDFGNSSKISQEKKNSAIYTLSNNSDFYNMAISNDFVNENFTRHIKKAPLKEYKPICAIYNFTIYEHKSNNEFFVSTHFSGSPQKYDSDFTSVEKFKRDYGFIYYCYLNDLVFFESYELEILLTKIFK